jgi:magnesium transporter
MDKKISHVSEYLTTAVPTAKATDSVGAILDGLGGRRFESIHSVYVVGDDGSLLGAATLADLYAASRDARVQDLMQEDPPCVRADVDREDAASLAVREELAVVPVVGAAGRFLGVFPAHAIMQVLRDEHLEDLHHMAGIWHHSDQARRALEASPLRRARYRLPWLIVGLVGSMLATLLVAQFEQVLEAQIAVAFFIPAIVYLADAVGTQSEAVAVRGLSLTEVGIARLLRGEIAVGMLMGVVLSVLAGAFAVAAFGRLDLAVAVAAALFGACAIATSVGLFLPWVFAQANWDPALASGPVGTIIQDVLSLLIYFAAASMLL